MDEDVYIIISTGKIYKEVQAMSITDSLLVSLFGIAVVFAVLFVLSLLIRLQSALVGAFSGRKAGKGEAADAQEPPKEAAATASAEAAPAEPARLVETDAARQAKPAVAAPSFRALGGRKYNAVINGKKYELEVEELGGSGARTAAPATAAAAEASARQAPAPKPARADRPAPEPAAAEGGSGDIVKAPVPGVVLDIKTSVGARVKRGEVLLLIEAMKMENEIVAARDGVVAQILVAKGASVAMGTPLVVIK
jgi:glutaconyl-CoA decarboxylase